jgi:Trk K+ transport system NAD-binding subunit
MFDAELARKVERGFGIHTAFSTSGLAAPAFAAAATRAHIEYSFYVDGQLLHVAQVPVEPESSLVGQTVEQVERQYNLTVVMHRKPQEQHLHPQSDEVLSAGDGIVVVASLEVLGRIASASGRSEKGALSDPRNWLRRLVAGARRRRP